MSNQAELQVTESSLSAQHRSLEPSGATTATAEITAAEDNSGPATAAAAAAATDDIYRDRSRGQPRRR